MNKVFEDEFMELQAGLISFCMEVVGNQVSKIYAYCSNEEKSKMFNVFFDVKGEIKTLDKLKVEDELAWQLLKGGTKELVKLDEICTKHNMPIPTELKLYYDVKTGKFDAKYKYGEVCSAKTGIAAEEVFRDWMAEMKEESLKQRQKNPFKSFLEKFRQ